MNEFWRLLCQLLFLVKKKDIITYALTSIYVCNTRRWLEHRLIGMYLYKSSLSAEKKRNSYLFNTFTNSIISFISPRLSASLFFSNSKDIFFFFVYYYHIFMNVFLSYSRLYCTFIHCLFFQYTEIFLSRFITYICLYT